ncbi:hypothetical protein NEMIN01_0884 [Nematocida minor]|uniref:uncharacterized protein n=1 Tax=Nematocida minor TaxID=1912983 RepID=UPI0022206943|nr:uncharacterized protein NEMIN01_0884 [Nematocida minor]KAI5190099.1 hypothetical protein NEMIN01_0884 [Nematocida minor]
MAEQNEYIDEFIDRMYGIEREQPIERLILSLDSLPIILNIPIKSNSILQEVKRKMHDHRRVRVTKKIMKRLIEVIIDSAKTNKVNIYDIENTFKGSPHYDLDTSNTIILPDAPDETQYEFKSILEDVTEGVQNLAEKTQNSLDINMGVTDRFIQQKKNERLKRFDEIKDTGNILPKKDTLYNWSVLPNQKPIRSNDKCNEILSRINDIIEKSEGPRTFTAMPRSTGRSTGEEKSGLYSDQVKKLESYETHFNEKMLSLLTDLSDKLAKPASIPLSDLKEEIEKKDLNELAVLPRETSQSALNEKIAPWSELAKYGGVGMVSGIFMGVFLMYSVCNISMPY